MWFLWERDFLRESVKWGVDTLLQKPTRRREVTRPVSGVDVRW